MSTRGARGALPPIEIFGSRAPSAKEAPVVPFPANGPLKVATADSIIAAVVDLEENGPRTRYDTFDVDLDGDGTPEEIAQVARITTAGVYSRCWWGIYAGGKLDQVLYWIYSEQKTRLARLPHPQEPPLDGADSLSVMQSIPEFFPLVDAVACGDITGDGRPETALWMLSAFRQPDLIQSILAYAILSPVADGPPKVVYRGHALYTAGARSVANGPIAACLARGYRVHTRMRSSGMTTDILLEPWLPMAADSLCDLPRINEILVPHDPDAWMPPFTMSPTAPIPGSWMISRWDGEGFGPLRFVKDVKPE
jgi:hypothetical protein